MYTFRQVITPLLVTLALPTFAEDQSTPTVIDTLFYESFNQCSSKGGNDNKWSGTIASGSFITDNDGWSATVGRKYGANKCARFGISNSKADAITPTISFAGSAILTFRAGAWDSTSEGTTLALSVTSGTLSQTTFEMQKGAWTDYQVLITDVTNPFQITFASKSKTNNRFFLDDVLLVSNETPLAFTAHTTSDFYATFSSDKAVQFLDATTTVYTLSIDNNIVFNEITDKKVPANTGVLLKSTSPFHTTSYCEIDDIPPFTNNFLHPSSEPMPSNGDYFYKLAYDNWTGDVSTSTHLGFYMVNDNGGPFTIRNGLAYLEVPSSSATKTGFILDDAIHSTAIPTLYNISPSPTTAYNLSGQPVPPTTKGIIILNGKKHLNR